MTKSRISWLCDEDANTHFFHTSTLTKRRRNRITSLDMNAGDSLDNPEAIHKHIYYFFQILYTTKHLFSPWKPLDGSIFSRTPDEPLRDTKITLAVKSFKPTKAPRFDGLHPLFFPKVLGCTWWLYYCFLYEGVWIGYHSTRSQSNSSQPDTQVCWCSLPEKL